MTGRIIREAAEGDDGQIADVVTAAFGRPDEAELVAALRDGGDAVLSLVAEAGGSVVGHILFSRLTFEPDPGSPPLKVSGLAPVAVVPDCHGQGIGSALIREGLHRLAAGDEDLCLVLGEPAYYGRFGFDAALAGRFACAYAGPYLMACALSPLAASASGSVHYPEAFGTVD